MTTPKPPVQAEVLRIAALARLVLSDAEAEAMTPELAEILAHVAKLEEVDVTGVEATAHAVGFATPLRDDVSRPGLDLERALANAPERIGDGFGVPKILE
ncbi:MAG: Asp-tRNA(Asn)/Glu-tRNA(Gln) amidotransferase subunit GatC [Deltaproteobacteria bacterium]|nr:Asp-tRNA(Asn)/Glu-tRNA(Gln) amidotransferase subunit GatC [Deltaproteobacteria bacterium]